MYVEPLHLCLAFGPLAVYLILLGVMNLSSRPFLTTGARDTATLGVAISGFVFAGPMELFLPQAASARFGVYVWLLLLGFYILSMTLLVLLLRPRLVIYNVTSDQLRPLLAQVVSKLDSDARWAGESLILPNLGVQLYLEPFATMKNTQLVSSGPRQNFAGWRKLEIALVENLKNFPGSPNPYGYSLLFFGLMLTSTVAYCVIRFPQEVAQGLREMLGA